MFILLVYIEIYGIAKRRIRGMSVHNRSFSINVECPWNRE